VDSPIAEFLPLRDKSEAGPAHIGFLRDHGVESLRDSSLPVLSRERRLVPGFRELPLNMAVGLIVLRVSAGLIVPDQSRRAPASIEAWLRKRAFR
jgi:hypothetical protein